MPLRFPVVEYMNEANHQFPTTATQNPIQAKFEDTYGMLKQQETESHSGNLETHTYVSSETSSYSVIGVTTIESTFATTVFPSETPSSSEPPTSDSVAEIPHTVTLEHTSTITMEDTPTISTVFLLDPSDIIAPGVTHIIPSNLPTSTAAPSSKSLLSTVELVGVVIGTLCLLAMLCIPILFVLWRRRRSPPSDSQNNINIRVNNDGRSRWSHSDDSVPTPLPTAEPIELKEIKTETVKRPLTRVMSPPPHYNDYWKGENEDYEMGVRGTGGEPSGSQYSEPQYSDPKGKGKARDDSWN
ncbi:hypothetical protein FIE12Z_4546 [Fusarium flagelliforme]|uniref:Uncharacterized protein n=1 Tax=Fusarium flagelliforme TaxID=2675880 RepID=A0A395MTF2_9HYPO|nr:hypothetical protein FIE12Z_4546 [Fusarium flagelliforme]